MSNQIVLCIGAPRSGTTWLFSLLRQTNTVFVPCVKEVRHFMSKPSDYDISQVYNNLVNRIETEEDSGFLEKWAKLGLDDHAGYMDMMLNSSKKGIAIDITPIYCIAPRDQVHEIAQTVGRDAKIVFMIRNIVDREYSQANLHFHMIGKQPQPVPINEYLELLSVPDQVRRSDYLATIDTWSNEFKADNVLIVFYDDLAADPFRTLERICQFIGVQENLKKFSSVTEKFGRSDRQDWEKIARAPLVLKNYIAARNLCRLKEISERYPKETRHWYEEAKALVNESNSTAPDVAAPIRTQHVNICT